MVEPEAMLLAWADAYSYKQNGVSEFYSLESVADAEVAVAAWCRDNGSLRVALCGHRGDYDLTEDMFGGSSDHEPRHAHVEEEGDE